MPKARLKGSEEQRILGMQPVQQEDDMGMMVNGTVLTFQHYTPGDAASIIDVATTTVKGWLPDIGIQPEMISNGQVILTREEVKQVYKYSLERRENNARVGKRNSNFRPVPVTPPPPPAPLPRRGRPVRRSPL